MVEVEVFGAGGAGPGRRGLPSPGEVAELARLALASAGIDTGHVAVAFVGERRMRALNREHRGIDAVTDVLSFPVDGPSPSPGPRELGDVVICPARSGDLREAVLHGALHLTGMDHEADEGEMLALQAELLRWLGP